MPGVLSSGSRGFPCVAHVLTAMRDGDEGIALAVRALRRDDVAGFVADEQSALDLAGRAAVDVQHAHAVGQVIDDPELVSDGAQGDGPHADLHRAAMLHAVPLA